MFAYQEARELWRITLNSADMIPLWPVFWASDSHLAANLLMPFLLVSALFAVALPGRRWPRILVFLAYLEVSAFRASFGLGSINHGSHYWIWIGICFCFLPAGSHGRLNDSRNGRYHFLMVFWFTQALIMLFYSMSGFWKVADGLGDLFAGEFSGFHPTALATTAAHTMLQRNNPTMLGPWIVEHPLAGWPLFLWVIYVELVALLVMFRPALLPLWGIMLILFHIGTLMLLGISFAKHVIVLTLLFVWSPFALGNHGIPEMVRALPGIAWLFQRQSQNPAQVRAAAE